MCFHQSIQRWPTKHILALLLFSIQMLMSAPVTMVVVHKSVPTLLVATHVDATLDMSWMEMNSLAMVHIKVF